MRKCNKCKKYRRRFLYSPRTCNVCWKKKQNLYRSVQYGIKPPSKGRERRERIRQNGGYYTSKEWNALKKKYNYRCLRCGKQEPEIRLQADHVVPVIRGGPSWIWNIQPLCERCNGQKGGTVVDYRGVRFEEDMPVWDRDVRAKKRP
jgi:5-methylcytosine-specific restriction endonuclease McrA